MSCHWPAAASVTLPCFPKHSPWNHLGCNTSCCYSYNSPPLILICPWLSALPSHFCSNPLKSESIRGCPVQPLVLLAPFPFLLKEEHLQLQIQSDISQSVPTLLRQDSSKNLWLWYLGYLSSDLWEVCFPEVWIVCFYCKTSPVLDYHELKNGYWTRQSKIWIVGLPLIGNIT